MFVEKDEGCVDSKDPLFSDSSPTAASFKAHSLKIIPLLQAVVKRVTEII